VFIVAGPEGPALQLRGDPSRSAGSSDLAGRSAGSLNPAAPAAPDVAAIDRAVEAERARQKIPGVAVAVVRKGQPVVARGYGLANVEHNVPVTRDTIFQSGSVGKQFTAAAAMLLVEDGRIGLDDPATKFFPDAPSHWSRIKVRHLLTHTSGLPDYTAGTVNYRRDYSEDELLTFAYGLTPEFEPGARWNYSNTGYVVLGILIHKASGTFYGDVLKARVFAPLGMKTARVISEEDIVPHRADGYRLAGGQLKHHQWVAPRLNTTADGSLYLSLNDMLAWDAGLRAQKVLKPESWKRIFTPATLNSGKTYPYGFGWQVDDFAGHRAQRHGGAWQGFKSHIARYPDDDLTIIVLANLAQANPERISDAVAAVVDPTLTPPPLKPIPDTDPEMQARVRRLLAEAKAGTLKPEEFAYMRAGFFPRGPLQYAEGLKNAGALKSLTLLESRELGDDRVVVYDAAFETLTVRVRLAVAPDGKIAQFGLSPRQEGQ
jgi:CubicO group peptidase (beta-lactamase class C family)